MGGGREVFTEMGVPMMAGSTARALRRMVEGCILAFRGGVDEIRSSFLTW
jgi:hypothetical protein